MKLITYRLNTEDFTGKKNLLIALRDGVLKGDSFWHFFLDPEGGTLRFQVKNDTKVNHWLKYNAKNYHVKYLKRTIYEPSKHEYQGVSFLGDDVLPLFHEMSLLTLKYPAYIIVRPILERLNHGLVNMTGVHDFTTEALLYNQLAEGRARLVGKTMSYPAEWIRRFYYNFISRNHKENSEIL